MLTLVNDTYKPVSIKQPKRTGIPKKTMERYEVLVCKRHMLEKSEINALSKLFGSARFSSNKDRKEDVISVKMMLEQRLEERTFDISEEQSEFGIQWLRSNILNKKGELRRSKLAEEFTEREAEVIRTFSKFEFVGFQEHCNRIGEAVWYTPIYRTISTTGAYFDYTPLHWGKPMIVVGA